MAIAVASVTTRNFDISGTSSTNVTLPSGTAEGDLLLIFLVYSANTNESYSFTYDGLIYNDIVVTSPSSSDQQLYVGYRTATAGDISNGYLTFNSGDNYSSSGGAIILRITGSGGGSFIQNNDDYPVGATTTPSYDVTITPNYANSLLVFCEVDGIYNGATTQSASNYAIANDNPSWTEAGDIVQNDSDGAHMAVAYAVRPETTATGNASCTLGFAKISGGFLFAIAPSAGADGNHSILTSTSSIFNHTISVGTTANHTILTQPHEIFNQNGKIEENRWTDTEKGTKSWTNQKK